MDYLPGRKFEELQHTTVSIDLYTIKIKYITLYETGIVRKRELKFDQVQPSIPWNYLEDDGEHPVIVLYCPGIMCWCMNHDYWWMLSSHNRRVALYPGLPLIDPNVTKRTVGDRDAVFNLIGDLC